MKIQDQLNIQVANSKRTRLFGSKFYKILYKIKTRSQCDLLNMISDSLLYTICNNIRHTMEKHHSPFILNTSV